MRQMVMKSVSFLKLFLLNENRECVCTKYY